MKGRISNTIDKIFNIVKKIVIYSSLFLFSTYFISSKLFTNKLKNTKTTILIKIFFKNKFVK